MLVSQKPVQDTTGHLLSQICKLNCARIHARLEEVGLYGEQQFTLHVLWENERLTHSAFAERLHVQPATITNALKQMERSGFVERRHDSDAQRVSRIYLTDEGRSVRGAVGRMGQEIEEQTFAALHEEERAQLHRLLLRIYEAFVGRAGELGFGGCPGRIGKETES
jgi:DNA-binding MarR family transcriptional regulator